MSGLLRRRVAAVPVEKPTPKAPHLRVERARDNDGGYSDGWRYQLDYGNGNGHSSRVPTHAIALTLGLAELEHTILLRKHLGRRP